MLPKDPRARHPQTILPFFISACNAWEQKPTYHERSVCKRVIFPLRLLVRLNLFPPHSRQYHLEQLKRELQMPCTVGTRGRCRRNPQKHLLCSIPHIRRIPSRRPGTPILFRRPKKQCRVDRRSAAEYTRCKFCVIAAYSAWRRRDIRPYGISKSWDVKACEIVTSGPVRTLA